MKFVWKSELVFQIFRLNPFQREHGRYRYASILRTTAELRTWKRDLTSQASWKSWRRYCYASLRESPWLWAFQGEQNFKIYREAAADSVSFVLTVCKHCGSLRRFQKPAMRCNSVRSTKCLTPSDSEFSRKLRSLNRQRGTLSDGSRVMTLFRIKSINNLIFVYNVRNLNASSLKVAIVTYRRDQIHLLMFFQQKTT